MQPNLRPDFPELMSYLFLPKRYKVYYGGRGAGRSWNFARALLIKGAGESLRVLCVRELMNSIAESVHKVLADQIVILGLQNYYEIQEKRIISKINGTSFSFEGIKNNASKVRSYEGIDVCWAEEAAKITKDSWKILAPTIRKKGSEIWMSFNPEEEDDYTYVRWVLDDELKESQECGKKVMESERSYVVRMDFEDNPWFSDELREEMEYEKAHDFDSYLHVWKGECKVQLEGAIYAKQLRNALEEGRIGIVPYWKESPVETFWDLGRADCTAIWFVQQVAMQYRVLDYVEDSFEDDVGYYLNIMQAKGYTYGTVHLPHDGKAKRLGTKRSVEEQIRGNGFKVKIVPKASRSDGINAVRMIFPRCYFDAKRCKEGLNALKHYKYKMVNGKALNEPLHDWASDGADAFRTFAMGIKLPKEEGKVLAQLEKARDTRLKKAKELPTSWMS